jgi:hypothetical protein
MLAAANFNLESFLAGVVVVAGFAVVSWLSAAVSGWRALARIYAAKARASGVTYRMQTGKLGLVNYGGCLTISLSDAGLRLAVWPMFRFAHPPLMIPWSDIRHIAHFRGLIIQREVFALGEPEICELALSPRVFQHAADKGYLERR